MRSLPVALLVVATFALAQPAQAAPIQFTVGSIQVVDSYNYNFGYANVAPLLSFTLDTAGIDSTTQNLFQIPYGSSFRRVSGDHTGAVTMTLGFSSPAGLPTSTDTGTLFANSVTYGTDNVSVPWGAGGPYVALFGYNDTGKLQIDMANATSDVSGSRWVAGTFTLLNDPEVEPLPLDAADIGGTDSSAVPEPASMALLGSGLFGVAGVTRRLFRNGLIRARSKAAAATYDAWSPSRQGADRRVA
jgi:hypothetical protein